MPISTVPRSRPENSLSSCRADSASARIALRAGEQGRPLLGQLHPARRAVQQLDPELPFEPLDLLGDGGLRHVQLLAGAGEMPVPGDGREILELAKLHRR